MWLLTITGANDFSFNWEMFSSATILEFSKGKRGNSKTVINCEMIYHNILSYSYYQYLTSVQMSSPRTTSPISSHWDSHSLHFGANQCSGS